MSHNSPGEAHWTLYRAATRNGTGSGKRHDRRLAQKTGLRMSTPKKGMLKKGCQRFWRRHFGHLLGVLLLLAALPIFAQYDTALQYQKRGNRYEGLKTRMVSGYDIELLSALVDWHEPSTAWPENLHLKFYLPVAEPVFVTVRQPRPKATFYWLPKGMPPPPPRAGGRKYV